MNELKSNLRNVEVGDWACSLFNGWDTVSEIKPPAVYLKHGHWFYMDGRYDDDDKYPTCFTTEQVPQAYIDLFGPPPEEFKRGEVVWCSDDEMYWNIAVFTRMTANGTFQVSHSDSVWKEYKYCRKIKNPIPTAKLF